MSSGSFGDLVQIAGRESIDYLNVANVTLTNTFGTDVFNIYPTNVVNYTGTFTVNGDAGVAPAPLADDVVNLYGTAANDVITTTATAVTVNGRAITIGANFIEAGVYALGGNGDLSLKEGQESSDYNNRAVEFRLEEQIPNTNQWRVFAKAVYTLTRSFASDFDF